MREKRIWLNEKRDVVDPNSPDAVIIVDQVLDDEGDIIEEKIKMREDYLKSLGKTKPKE